MSFEVEETEPEMVVQQGEDKVIHRTVTTSPKTGDYRNMLLFSGIALAGGVPEERFQRAIARLGRLLERPPGDLPV